MFFDIGGIVEPHCLEVIVCFAYHLYLVVIVRFVDIYGIVGHHCLNLLFIIYIYIYIYWFIGVSNVPATSWPSVMCQLCRDHAQCL